MKLKKFFTDLLATLTLTDEQKTKANALVAGLPDDDAAAAAAPAAGAAPATGTTDPNVAALTQQNQAMAAQLIEANTKLSDLLARENQRADALKQQAAAAMQQKIADALALAKKEGRIPPQNAELEARYKLILESNFDAGLAIINALPAAAGGQQSGGNAGQQQSGGNAGGQQSGGNGKLHKSDIGRGARSEILKYVNESLN